jgi:hypothetical protein
MGTYGKLAVATGIGVLAMTLSGAFAQSLADAREDRVRCWESYSFCVVGAGEVESWRTVCYSDYTACMQDPAEIECRDEDRTFCQSASSRCTSRLGGRDTGAYQCGEDHRVCLDAHDC